MWRVTTLATGLLGFAFAGGVTSGVCRRWRRRAQRLDISAVSVAHWNINTYSPEAERIFHQIETDGVAVFRAQPGFVRYRLMRTDSATTVAVAEWETEQLGLAGAEQYRAWMRRTGIMDRFTLETRAGEIVAGS